MTFLADEQISPRVARALRVMGQPVYHVNEVEELGRGAKDPVILPYCGKFDTVLVTLDRRILRTPHLHALLSEYEVAAFFVRSHKKGSPDPWVIFKILVKQWETIVRIAETEERPFAKMVRPRGAIRNVKWPRGGKPRKA